ncbi:uncharacterized protein LOC121924317 [Sceloporus undulatus]|uniref:uncharacterized protein LOC121924317 n=1 Tax=Sceloporus undulatus TaxID=8520 RepID=UPI001C4C25BD|nr:uncharacterized protein LOC121924317 [Sceloporus undulatus]
MTTFSLLLRHLVSAPQHLFLGSRCTRPRSIIDLDCFYDSETDRYFVAVSWDEAYRRLSSKATVPPMQTSISKELPARSTGSPGHTTVPLQTCVATTPPTGRAPALTSKPLPPVPTPSRHAATQIDTNSGSNNEGSHASRVDLGSSDEVAPQSPQELYQPGSSSPMDDVRTFSEHVIKMANTLELQLSHVEEEAKDAVERRIHGKVPTPTFISLLPSLESTAKRSWDIPASLTTSSRKIESLYRISPCQCSWLMSHPKQNSTIVKGSQQAFTPKMSTSPADREAKKIASLAKKAYSASVLGLKVACMGAYLQCLMEKISPVIPDDPDEAHSTGGWLITSVRLEFRHNLLTL